MYEIDRSSSHYTDTSLHFISITMIIHSKFTRQLWIHMSYLPLNKDYFDPVDTPFERIFGSEIVKWTDVRAYLQDHMYFNSTLVGVFSGKKMPGY